MDAAMAKRVFGVVVDCGVISSGMERTVMVAGWREKKG
jgi:hypothetical protein